MKLWKIKTIGYIANRTPDFLKDQLGVMGTILYSYAHGMDNSPALNQSPDAKTLRPLSHL